MLHNLINQGFVVQANDVRVLHHPSEYLATLLELIAKAQQRILINCLYLENDESGQRVMNALIAAVRQNPHLQVDIFLDLHRALRSRMGQTKVLSNAHWAYNTLARLNAELRKQYNLTRNPINVYGVPCNARELFGVYHVKGLVVDDTVLYTGASINNNYCAFQTYRQDRYQLITNKALADSFYHFPLAYFAHNRFAITTSHNDVTIELLASDPNSLESQVQDATPVAEGTLSLGAMFSGAIANFANVAYPRPQQKERFLFKSFRQNYLFSPLLQYLRPHASSKVNELLNNQLIVVPIFGIGKQNQINTCVFEALAMARHSITIFTPYFNFTKKLTKRIISRCKAGIKVKIIVSDKVANDFYNEPEADNYTSANSLPYLYELNLRKFLRTYADYLNNGTLEVYAWSHDNNSYHAKGLCVDDETYIFTGSNLNLRSFNIDAENALICYDPYHNLKPLMQAELEYLQPHLTQLHSYDQLDNKKDYPANVRKTLQRASIFFIDKLAKRLF